jgi:BMFP domain-containing protein YqiC
MTKPSDRIRQIASERGCGFPAATMLYLDEAEEQRHPMARAHSLASMLPDRSAELDLEMLDRGPASAPPDLIHGVGHRERLAAAPCRCIACVPQPAFNAMMRVCQLCGNKRCPHTQDHRNICTNSNDTDQRAFTWGQAIVLVRQERDTLRARVEELEANSDFAKYRMKARCYGELAYKWRKRCVENGWAGDDDHLLADEWQAREAVVEAARGLESCAANQHDYYRKQLSIALAALDVVRQRGCAGV